MAGVQDFFFFCLDLELFEFVKIKNDQVSTYLFFTFLLITQDLNKTKSQTSFCRHSYIGNVCKVSPRNIKLCGS